MADPKLSFLVSQVHLPNHLSKQRGMYFPQFTEEEFETQRFYSWQN